MLIYRIGKRSFGMIHDTQKRLVSQKCDTNKIQILLFLKINAFRRNAMEKYRSGGVSSAFTRISIPWNRPLAIVFIKICCKFYTSCHYSFLILSYHER